MPYRFEIDRGDALYSEPVAIVLRGARAGELIELELTFEDASGLIWCSQGRFLADSTGTVDLRNAPSRAGSYCGIDPDALWWSMRPQGMMDAAQFLANATDPAHMMGGVAGDPLIPRQHMVHAKVNGVLVAQESLIRRRLAKGITALPVSQGRLRGIAFIRDDRAHSRGGILLVTGSSGGVELSFAPLLASEGYDVLSVAHFNWPDRPATLASIDLEYFVEAFDWIRGTFGHERVSVQGTSRGGELALILGAYFPQRVAGVVGIVPNSHVFAGWNSEGWTVPAWTFRGEPLKFGPLGDARQVASIVEAASTGSTCGLIWKEVYARTARRSEAVEWEIPIERTSGPILLISGAQDVMWDSADGSDRVIDRLRVHGFPHPYQHLRLAGVGHIVPTPHGITSLVRSLYHPLVKELLACGGDPVQTGAAGWTVWNALTAHHARCVHRR